MRTTSLVASVSRKAGGLFESVRRLHQELARLPGVSVKVLALADEFTRSDLGPWGNLPVDTFPTIGPAALGFSPGLRNAVMEAREDLLHTHGLWMYPSIASRDWHRKTGRPYLISPHGMLDRWALRNSGWKKKLALLLYESKHLRKAACIHALNQAEAQSIRKFGLKNPVCVIPNGVDIPSQLPGLGEPGLPEKGAGRGRLGEPALPFHVRNPRTHQRERVRVLLYLGRLHRKKGLLNLLRGWSQAKAQQPRAAENWMLAVAGWDQQAHEQELKTLASQLGLAWVDARNHKASSQTQHLLQHLHLDLATPVTLAFLGPRFGAEKHFCYENCDAVVLPSLSEGLPMAVLEAWAYARPVVMTPECNLPEGFAAGAALRAADADPSSLGAALGQLWRLPEPALREMGARGRQLVADQFAWPRIARDMKRVYEWVLGAAERPSCVQ